jgi:hypothetical protein
MITRGPHTRDTRVRFIWWPTRVMLPYARWVWTGEPPVKYTPGWLNGHYGYPGGVTPRHKANQCGGMVCPVERRHCLPLNGWMWLDYLYEQYEVYATERGESRGRWVPAQIVKQWNLWHEYND